MQWRRGSWPSGLPYLVPILSLVVLVVVALPYLGLMRLARPEERAPRTARVRQVAWLTSTIDASGRVASRNNTEIRCTLERVGSSGGGGVSGEGASTILSLIPDGTTVKEGDLLCELDSSNYTELVRRQAIGVQKAQAEYLQAELSLSVAKINLQTFLEGTLRQADQEFKGQIALSKSTLGRQADRVLWAKRMLDKGYLALSGYTGEEQQLLVQRRTLEQTEISYENYQKYTVPKELRTLQSQVEGAKSTLSYQATRLKLETDRLAAYEEQVKRCTIRAPHEGFLIYANEQGEAPRVYEGASVRQRQRLFELPDLSRMEVQTLIHETVVDQIRPGMRARISIEALPGRLAEGRVVSVSQFPLLDRSQNAKNDVKYYMGVIELERIPSGLRPGMSAEVEITTGRRPSVLVVPPPAVVSLGGRDYCQVIHPDRVERRAVKVGQRTSEMFEILDGLSSGDVVSLEPLRPGATIPVPRPDRVAASDAPAGRPSASPPLR